MRGYLIEIVSSVVLVENMTTYYNDATVLGSFDSLVQVEGSNFTYYSNFSRELPQQILRKNTTHFEINLMESQGGFIFVGQGSVFFS